MRKMQVHSTTMSSLLQISRLEILPRVISLTSSITWSGLDQGIFLRVISSYLMELSNGIKQGSLGVCYMLATVSALAEVPKHIENMFVFSDTSIGFYVLWFYINGKPKFITVDDQIPCNKTTKSPLFTKPIGN